jgi:hypothetical protein
MDTSGTSEVQSDSDGHSLFFSLEGLQRSGQMRRINFLLSGQLNCVRFLDLDQTKLYIILILWFVNNFFFFRSKLLSRGELWLLEHRLGRPLSIDRGSRLRE